MKKIIFLTILILINCINFTNASNNTVGPYDTLEECTKVRNENNNKSGDYQNYERSNCYSNNGIFEYLICKKGEECTVEKKEKIKETKLNIPDNSEKKENETNKIGNTDNYSINGRTENVIESVKKELEGTKYSFKDNEGSSGKSSYHIFYDDRMVGYIYESENGISMGSGWQENGEVGTFFSKKDLKKDDILKYFYKLNIKESNINKNNFKIINKKISYNTSTKNARMYFEVNTSKKGNFILDFKLKRKFPNGGGSENKKTFNLLEKNNKIYFGTIYYGDKGETFIDGYEIKIYECTNGINGKICSGKKEVYSESKNNLNISTSKDYNLEKNIVKNNSLSKTEEYKKSISKYTQKKVIKGRLETDEEQIKRLEKTIEKLKKVSNDTKYKDNKSIQNAVKIINNEIQNLLKKIKLKKEENIIETKDNRINQIKNQKTTTNEKENKYIEKKKENFNNDKIKKYKNAIKKYSEKKTINGKIETDEQQLKRLKNTIEKIKKVSKKEKYKNNSKIQGLINIFETEINNYIKKLEIKFDKIKSD